MGEIYVESIIINSREDMERWFLCNILRILLNLKNTPFTIYCTIIKLNLYEEIKRSRATDIWST